MARRLTEGKLVIASHNPGKAREIAELLRPYGVEAVAAGALGLAEPEEAGTTFRDNAEAKARAAARASGLPALADDSGLTVPALGGAPGIHSARWAGPERDFARAMRRVMDELGDRDDRRRAPMRSSDRGPHRVGNPRRAEFVCALALCWPDGGCETFEGRVAGTLVWPPRGGRGFGYDPIFQPDGFDVTFGEMDPARKHTISHRADAFRKLVAACLTGAP